MTDRELLEAAAKAAGMRVNFHPAASYTWNPLTDDGDALRLAVKLDLCLVPYPIYARPKHSVCCTRRRADKDGVDVPDVVELYGDDPYAATRRAIVRAAAAIGVQK